MKKRTSNLVQFITFSLTLLLPFSSQISFGSGLGACDLLLLSQSSPPRNSLPGLLRRELIGLSTEGFVEGIQTIITAPPIGPGDEKVVAAEDLLFEKGDDRWKILVGNRHQRIAEEAGPPVVDGFLVMHTLSQICVRQEDCSLRSPKEDPLAQLVTTVDRVEFQTSRVAQPVEKTLVGATLLIEKGVNFLDAINSELSRKFFNEPQSTEETPKGRTWSDNLDFLRRSPDGDRSQDPSFDLARKYLLDLAIKIESLLSDEVDDLTTWVDESGNLQHLGYWSPLGPFKDLSKLYNSSKEFYLSLALFLTIIKDRNRMADVLRSLNPGPLTAQEIAFKLLAAHQHLKSLLYGTPYSGAWSKLGEDLSSDEIVRFTPEAIRDVTVFTQFLQNYFPLRNGNRHFPMIYEGLVLISKKLGVFLAPPSWLRVTIDAMNYLKSGGRAIVRVSWDTSKLPYSVRLERSRADLVVASGLLLTGSTGVLRTPGLLSPDAAKVTQSIERGQAIDQPMERHEMGVGAVSLPKRSDRTTATTFTIYSREGLLRVLSLARLPSTYRSYATTQLREIRGHSSSSKAFREELDWAVQFEWFPKTWTDSSETEHFVNH